MWSFTFQINWKQRFFIPTDETTGVEILSALLDRYPVVAGEEEANDTKEHLAEIDAHRQMNPTKVVDLEEWIIAADESPGDETVNEIDRQLEGERPTLVAGAKGVLVDDSEAGAIFTLTQQSVPMSWIGQATSTTQLAFDFGRS
jgi:hypothetical protein